MNWTRIIVFASLIILGACSESRGIKTGDTQIVAQWLQDEPPAQKGAVANIFAWLRSAFDQIIIEIRVSNACEDICFLDGNDIGSGTYNLFLYSQDVPETVKRLVDLEKAGRLPSGLRIGVAKYTDPQHKDWTYEPVHPATLKTFEIFYRAKSKEQSH